ncbi:MAG: adenylate/guanylate cyclase domain-containing protein [Bacteroidota bacterium]
MKKILTLCLILVAFVSHSQNQKTIDSLRSQLAVAKEDSNKIHIYLALIKGHIQFKTNEGYQYQRPAIALAQKLNRKKDVYVLKAWAARLYWAIGKFDSALIIHQDALRMAEEAKDKKNTEMILRFIGQDYADQSMYSQAINYFKKALIISETLNDKEALAKDYSLLNWVYYRMGNYPEAMQYQYKTLELFEQKGNKEGAARCQLDIADYQESIGNDSLAEIFRNKALKILEKSKNATDLQIIHDYLSEYYIRKRNYPEALTNIKILLDQSIRVDNKGDMAFGFFKMARIYKLTGNDTLALRNYLMAASNFENIFSTENVAAMYTEAASCYTRLKQYNNARKYFNEANTLLIKVNNISTTTNYLKNVEVLDSSVGNWKSAYMNLKHYLINHEKLSSEANSTRATKISMQYDFDRKNAAAKAEQEKKDIRQQNIRNSIAGVLAGTLIFLVVVYRQRNKISNARKRSDELLLNILPEEVAEELKEKGSADAKQFDEVTVLFTDFKGFTLLSEKLTPTELIQEINECFSAFDHIMQKYKVEKIKTIGDAYMAAGGLPVSNQTHAKDVVHAALDIQQFMKEHRHKKEAEGKLFFEIRIGVHTGPVIAGIVGVKKFAYDIWGDTVNIASRMESSGEAGKVNISSSTYELVKEYFSCIHRGKIQAKNKGEIDMYFVEAITEKAWQSP